MERRTRRPAATGHCFLPLGGARNKFLTYRRYPAARPFDEASGPFWTRAIVHESLQEKGSGF